VVVVTLMIFGWIDNLAKREAAYSMPQVRPQ
jgi:hypothetical protein